MLELLRTAERRTRPMDPDFAAAMTRRWTDLPEVVKTPGQVLGRFAPGCEGTHGVFPAWELMQQGVVSDDPRLRETQERLAAYHYAMGHPENGTLVPACVQHSVLDPAENVELRKLLPIIDVRSSARRNQATHP